MAIQRWLLCFVLLVAVGPWACTPSATPVLAVDPMEATIKRLEDPRVRQQFADVMATPEMQRAMGEVSAAFVKGVALGLSSEELANQLAATSRRMTGFIAESLAERMKKDVAPASAAVAAATVQAAMESAIRTAATELPAQLAPAMQQALTQSLGPAIEAVLRDNVGRGLTTLTGAPEFNAALGSTGRALARDVVFGANEAMAELEQRDAERGLLARTAKFFASAGWIVWVVVMAGAIALMAFGARRWQSRSRSRDAARDREIRETILLTIATTLRAAEGQPWAGDLRQVLRDKITEEKDMPWSSRSEGTRAPRSARNGARSEHHS